MTAITDYYKGKMCAWRNGENSVVGRIVGESDKGSWGTINDIPMYSIPLFSTPHGSIIRIGVLKLSEPTDKEIERIKEFEKDALANNDASEFYGGYLTASDIANSNFERPDALKGLTNHLVYFETNSEPTAIKFDE